MIALKRIFRYLNGTKNDALTYQKSEEMKIVAYSDASYAEDEGRKSTSGFVFFINGAALTWRSKKQNTVATSSMESEYIALSSAVKEAMWLMKFNTELNQSYTTINILEDNQACIKFAYDQTHSERSKHIDVRFHFVKEKIDAKIVKIIYCPTSEMIADSLTKPLDTIKFNKFKTAMLGTRKHSKTEQG